MDHDGSNWQYAETSYQQITFHPKKLFTNDWHASIYTVKVEHTRIIVFEIILISLIFEAIIKISP